MALSALSPESPRAHLRWKLHGRDVTCGMCGGPMLQAAAWQEICRRCCWGKPVRPRPVAVLASRRFGMMQALVAFVTRRPL